MGKSRQLDPPPLQDSEGLSGTVCDVKEGGDGIRVSFVRLREQVSEEMRE